MVCVFTYFRGMLEEALGHVGNNVGHELDAGKDHLLKVRFGLAVRLFWQKVGIDGGEGRGLDDVVVVGKVVGVLQRFGVEPDARQ